ncbi:MAG: DUF3616 domain-containing protein [Rubrivivax sp.]|nr:DUF3616 domain-containing protein [Rubrivivax sp.]
MPPAKACLVHANLSGPAFTGDWLWVAGDEACGQDRLRRLDPVGRQALRFGEVRDFGLADLLDLPGAAEEEADLEGMVVADGFLWMVGSHGLKPKNAKPDRGTRQRTCRGSDQRPLQPPMRFALLWTRRWDRCRR